MSCFEDRTHMQWLYNQYMRDRSYIPRLIRIVANSITRASQIAEGIFVKATQDPPLSPGCKLPPSDYSTLESY